MATTARPRFFKNGGEFRAWLHTNHASKAELLVGFYTARSGNSGLTYKDALDGALCYGWIDGVRKNVDASRYSVRFTPRKVRSHWSRINLARVLELRARRLMTPPGEAAYDRREAVPTINYSYELEAARFSAALERQLRSNKKAAAFFTAQPPGYRRLATFWVMSAKREDTRQTRFARLLTDSENERRLGPVTSPKAKPSARK